MKKLPYILKDISIHKMPGFPRGLKALNDLSAKVNIIVGPNASGKSSTARMIQQIIWQNKTKGIEVEASVELDEDSWEIKIDSGGTLVQRNGIDAEINGLPTTEGQHRYLLALHNLVEGKEEDLAKEITKQSIGGFDLDAAQNHLRYSSRFSNKANTEYKEFENAEKKYRQVRDQQRELKKDERNLTHLKSEKEKVTQAARLQEFYHKVNDYLVTKTEYLQYAKQLDGFSKSMQKLSGDEYQRIDEYENQIETCKVNIKKAEDEIEKSQNELKKLHIPKSGISEKVVDEIEKRIDRLSDFERNIQDLEKQIEGLIAQEKEVLKTFDESIDPTKWKGLKLEDISGLDKMLQDAHQLLGEKEFLLSEIKILEEEAKNHQNDNQRSAIFTQGIKTLSEWLKEPTGSKGISLGVVILISLAGVATAIITFLVGWPGLLGLILILILFLYAYFTKDKSSNSLNVRENDFTKSGLKRPSSWNTENVANRIDELIESLSNIKEAERISKRLINCKDSLSKLQPRMERLNTKREEWADKLQAAPGFPKNNSNDFSSLYWFLLQVKKWQDAHIQREALKAENTALKAQYQNELSKINTSFKNSNFAEVKDVIEGKASFHELKIQESTRKEQFRIIEQKNEDIKDQEKLELRDEENLSKIYQSLGIDKHDKENVRSLVNEIDNYKKIYKDHYAVKQVFAKKENVVKEHSLYNEEEIKALSVDQAKEKANQNKNIADGLEGIQKQITKIETLIQAEKKGHELEDVLSEKEEALDKLHQLYENDLSSVTGDLIIRQLKEETQNKNRPKVFNRANEIFNKITNGRYELSLEDKGEPNFRAIDTVLRLGQDLSELSTGTRVQLLLSVRLAYVETVESSIKLPLLADELLANSDDKRAKAIIEALIEISREGRQVFYFTAQADEVGKWLTHLEQTDLDYKIFQLNTGADDLYDYSDFKPDSNSFKLLHKVPEPNGKSHKEYGKFLQTQTFNLLLQNETELPLWYLIEDVDILYNCLHRGINTWGQLDSFYRNSGKIQNLEEDVYKQLTNNIEVLKRFQELYRKGRTRPIDRDILVDSGVITDTFMESVVEKLEELNRGPKQLIQALRAGEVTRFRADNIDELEQYLMIKGYIDDEEQQEPNDILIKIQALLSNLDIEINKAESFIKRILS